MLPYPKRPDECYRILIDQMNVTVSYRPDECDRILIDKGDGNIHLDY
jgi:hypothetical protein